MSRLPMLVMLADCSNPREGTFNQLLGGFGRKGLSIGRMSVRTSTGSCEHASSSSSSTEMGGVARSSSVPRR